MVKRLLVIMILAVIVSCNSTLHVEKRKYFKGYYVQLNKINHPVPQNGDNTPALSENLTASLNTQPEISNSVVNLSFLNSADEKSIASLALQNNLKHNHISINETVAEKKTVDSKTTLKKIQNKKKNGSDDGYLFGLAALMGLSMFGLLRAFKLTALKLSNWAARNKTKTKVLIGSIQIVYASLGIAIGKSLHDMGYEFSNGSNYVFSGIFLLGIISLFLQKVSSKTDLIKSFFRSKMIHMLIAVSSLMMMAIIGNKVGQNNPTNSPAGYVIEKIHNQSVDRDNAGLYTSENTVVKEKRHTLSGDGTVGGYIALTIVLGIVLGILCCVFWCWALLASPSNPMLFVLAIAFTALYAFILTECIKAVRRAKRERTAPKEQKKDP